MRIVTAAHGHDKAMGYHFRCRIESRIRITWFGFGNEITEFRPVIERSFKSWNNGKSWLDYKVGLWTDKQTATELGNKILDDLESTPQGEYI
tara:strand:+ start:9294 stop:9569 length:276 start_codon:yes stop_codon:yes gene_type:complete